MRQEGDEPAFVVWLTGPSGEGKSTLAALFLSFFGTFKSGLSLPASFKDTANAIEKKAHDLKDSLFVVDDYHPTATRKESQSMEQIAQFLLRGFGDRIGRTRMNADGTLKSSYVPKGVCLVSGEDIPQAGTSTTARIFQIEMKKGSINKARLTEAQTEAHRYAEVMTGYLQWLAPQMDELPKRLHEQFEQVRQSVAQNEYHGRMPGAIACLYLVFSLLCEYFASIGAIDENKRFWLCENALLYFKQSANQQAQEMKAENPAAQFVIALQELLSAKQVYAKKDGFDPELSGSGQFIGWHDDRFYYLLPDIVYSVVNQFYERQGQKSPISKKTLWKHLEDAGMIETRISGGRPYRTLIKKIGGENKWVLFLHRRVLEGDESNDCSESSN